MSRPIVSLFALATIAATAAFAQDSFIQNTYVAAPVFTNAVYVQQEPAAIERAPAAVRNRPGYSSAPRITSSQVVAGVWMRTEAGASVQTIAASKNVAEVRVESGRVNLAVQHPAQDTQILVDLPGGQTALLKDGVYTFNAATDTVHVLEGEAEAFPGNREGDGIKIKDNRMYTFGNGDAHAAMFEPGAANTDLLPGGFVPGGDGYGRRGYYGGEYLYAGSPYYGGFAPYYGYGFGNPYGYGYGWGPYGYGYPFGVGIGFGYWGGYGSWGGYRGGFGGFGGGYRGGFGGGFARGGFHR